MSSQPVRVMLLRSRKQKRVLYLECSKDFVDILISVLIMPVGVILKALQESGLTTGTRPGLFNMYASLKDMEESAFCVDKDVLLAPSMSFKPHDLLCITGAVTNKCLNCDNLTFQENQICDNCEVTTAIMCVNPRCGPEFSVHRYNNSARHTTSSNNCFACSEPLDQICDNCEATTAIMCVNPRCGPEFSVQRYNNSARHTTSSNNCFACSEPLESVKVLQKVFSVGVSKACTRTANGEPEKGFVRENITFMVKEDLSIMKSTTISSVAMLKSLGVDDFQDLDSKEVYVGRFEGLLLVYAAVISSTPLSHVFESIDL